MTEYPLDGYVVADLSSGIAGGYCTKLLADAGAEVIKGEAPEGDWLRSWSASGAEIAPGDDGALFSFLGCSKRGVVAEPDRDDARAYVTDLLAGADAVVWSRGGRLAEHPAFAPAEIRRSHPHLVVAAITPFGLDGPWHDRPATEFTVQAWSGGMIGLGRGAPDRAPVFVGGQVGEWMAGVHAAVGLLVARMRTLGTGSGELVDVSMLEALVDSLTCYPVTFLDMSGRPWRDNRSVNTPGVVSAKDGLVGLACGHAQQWHDFCVMIDHPEWIDDDELTVHQSRAARASELAPEINAWVRDRTIEEIRDLATAFRIPNAPIGNGATAPALDHFVERKAYVRNPRDGFLQPDHPYRLSATSLREPEPAPRLGQHTEQYRAARKPATRRSSAAPPSLPLAGLRVLDMTAYWAGPLCTHVLALLGAEVIHLESTGRPDGFRLLAGIPVTVDQWWERAPQFSGGNTNKSSVTLDFQDPRGRELLTRLIATCDVVVENYSPRVLDSIGLDFDAVRALRSDVVMVRMPGFGLDGPWRDIPAFAYVIEDASGLTWLTGYPDQNPLEPYSLGDPNAGIHAVAGLLLALEHRRRTGEAVLVEAPMISAAINVAAEQVVEYSAYGALLERAGNRGPCAAPQNLYLSADVDEFGRTDCWVAIAVETDAQWAALRDAIGAPEWASDPVLATAAGRRTHHDRVDREIAVWCSTRSRDEVVDCLWGAGVPVANVMQPHRIAELAQLDGRGFFEPVDHPVTGRSLHGTLPVRYSNGPTQLHVRSAPLLGEHNRVVLGALGLTDEELDELEAGGVIGTAPVGAR